MMGFLEDQIHIKERQISKKKREIRAKQKELDHLFAELAKLKNKTMTNKDDMDDLMQGMPVGLSRMEPAIIGEYDYE